MKAPRLTRIVVGAVLLPIVVVSAAVLSHLPGPIAIPPPHVITSADGNVEVGVSDRYGGAIVYYKDKRLSDSTPANGNIVNYTQAGALFQNALFMRPYSPHEQQMCNASQQQNGVCKGTVPYNNPTQGGYHANGWAGNPNGAEVSVANNAIYTASRLVNYNYDYGNRPLTAANREEWQTDFWQESYLHFDPLVPDVLVVDTKIAYCKDGNPYCAGKPAVINTMGVPAFFALGPFTGIPPIRGPYARVAYKSDSSSGLTIIGTTGPTIAQNNNENWAAVLQESQDVGLGLSVAQYRPYLAGHGYTLSAAPSPYIMAGMPDLQRFASSGISLRTYPDYPRFELQPGGWFEFRTYVATGDIGEIRANLLKAQSTGNSLPLHSFSTPAR